MANYFLSCSSNSVLPGRPVILGCPLDLTCTYRKGVGNAPKAIRSVSESLETYSPLLNLDLLEVPFSDIGDLDFHGCSIHSALKKIRRAVEDLIVQKCTPLLLGGEHTLTLAALEACLLSFEEVLLIHLDAHSDLRDEYEGNTLNHATVVRRIVEKIGPNRLIQIGIRAGTKEEFAWMKKNRTLIAWEPGSDKLLLQRIRDRPVYVSLDLDILDPACLPGTGNPEAGGWFYHDMERFLVALSKMNIIGADVVELNPSLDYSEASAITAAKIVREILLILGK